jgi:superfamily II DNA or RNA helicase
MQLRPYQYKLTAEIYAAWSFVRNIIAVLPTGGGKTVTFSNIISQHNGASCAIAHRSELVSQMSVALAKFGIKHRIIGQKNLIRWITQLHTEEFGKSFYNFNAQCAVASVDTIIRRPEELKSWSNQVTLWITDEVHHLLADNKWGKAVAMFPHAKGLGVTATPVRADGKGLGRYADGLMDYIVVGPGMRELINQGYLTDYRIFAPPNNLDLSRVDISTNTGDYKQNQLKTSIRKSTIIGNVVEHYLRIAPGKQGVTFATDVETAVDITNQYRQAGVSAETVSAKTPDKIRVEIVRRFRNREILQLVNVDIFGEGFDLPAIEVVSFARPTQSYVLYCQQFGRSLRIMNGKTHAIIIDHVGNVVRHGLPDRLRTWSLDRRERKSNGKDINLIPVRVCRQCTGVYESIYKICPYCGMQYIPAGRSTPEQVDGDLQELDLTVLKAMRGEIDRIDQPAARVQSNMLHAGIGNLPAAGAAKQHRLRQETQRELREIIATWGGIKRTQGVPDSQSYREFFYKYQIDVMTAQTLGRKKAEILNNRIKEDLNECTNCL